MLGVPLPGERALVTLPLVSTARSDPGSTSLGELGLQPSALGGMGVSLPGRVPAGPCRVRGSVGQAEDAVGEGVAGCESDLGAAELGGRSGGTLSPPWASPCQKLPREQWDDWGQLGAEEERGALLISGLGGCPFLPCGDVRVEQGHVWLCRNRLSRKPDRFSCFFGSWGADQEDIGHLIRQPGAWCCGRTLLITH